MQIGGALAVGLQAAQLLVVGLQSFLPPSQLLVPRLLPHRPFLASQPAAFSTPASLPHCLARLSLAQSYPPYKVSSKTDARAACCKFAWCFRMNALAASAPSYSRPYSRPVPKRGKTEALEVLLFLAQQGFACCNALATRTRLLVLQPYYFRYCIHVSAGPPSFGCHHLSNTWTCKHACAKISLAARHLLSGRLAAGGDPPLPAINK